MHRILFLPYHGLGHIIPTLSLATALLERDYVVTFGATPYFAPYVLQRGHSFFPLHSVPFGLGFEPWVGEQELQPFPYFANLHARITDKLYQQRKATLEKLIDAFEPHLILVDSTQATDFIVLYPLAKKLSIRMAVLHAMFPTHVMPGRPPGNTFLFPDDTRAAEEATTALNAAQRRYSRRQKIKYLGFDNQYLVERRFRLNNVDAKHRATLPSLLQYSVAGIPEFICAPREFDFPTFEPLPTQHYIGFQPPLESGLCDKQYEFKSQQIFIRRDSGQPLIYCAFGSIAVENKSLVHRLVRKIVEAVRGTSFQLILSLKESSFLGPLPPNVYAFASVPQPELLQHTDVFITHGGMNSIKEAVAAEVPMLMYVVHNAFEVKGNAARVAYHGLGMLGNVVSDDAAAIRTKLTELLQVPRYKERLAHMKARNSDYTTEKFIALLHQVSVP